MLHENENSSNENEPEGFSRRMDSVNNKSEIELSEISTDQEIKIEIDREVTPDAKASNSYAAKKTVAQGMMDIALITANANQLRYLIELNSKSSTFYLIYVLITISLILQIGVGVSLIFKGRMDVRGQSKHKSAKKINNYVVVGIFLTTIINVFIASFTTTTGSRNEN